MCGLDEPSTSGSKVQQKMKHKQPLAQGESSQGAPNMTEFMTYHHYSSRVVLFGWSIQQTQGGHLVSWLL